MRQIRLLAFRYTMSCCPPDSEKYLASDYATVGSVVSLPTCDFYASGKASSQKAVILIPDVFGWNAGRTRNLADWFGEAGYFAIVPKLLAPGLQGGTDGDGLFPGWDSTNPDHTALSKPYISQFTYAGECVPLLLELSCYACSPEASFGCRY